MLPEDLYYYIKDKMESNTRSTPGEQSLVKGKLEGYKRQPGNVKRQEFALYSGGGEPDIVRVRGETEQIQKHLSLLQKVVRSMEQYRTILQELLDRITLLDMLDSDEPISPAAREMIDYYLEYLEDISHGVQFESAGDEVISLLDSAYTPQKRFQTVQAVHRETGKNRLSGKVIAHSEQFAPADTHTIEELFGKSTMKPVIDVIKLDSVRTIRNFFTAGGMEEIKESFEGSGETVVFTLKRLPKPGSEIVTVNGKIIPKNKTVSNRPAEYSLDGATFTIKGKQPLPETFQVKIEYWTDTPVDTFHLTQPPLPGFPITAVTVRNRPVPLDYHDGYTFENGTISLHGSWIPDKGEDVQVTFQTGMRVRFIELRDKPPTAFVEVQINDTVIAPEMYTVLDRRIFFAEPAQPFHGDLIQIKEGTAPIINHLKLTREPIVGSVAIRLHSDTRYGTSSRLLDCKQVADTLLLSKPVTLEDGEYIRVVYRIQEPVRSLALSHIPVKGSLTIMFVPDSSLSSDTTGKGIHSKTTRVSNWSAHGNTVKLIDLPLFPHHGKLLVSYRWRDKQALRDIPCIAVKNSSLMVVPLDKPLCDETSVTVMVNGRDIPTSSSRATSSNDGYTLSNNVIIIRGRFTPKAGDEILISYDFGRAAPPVHAGYKPRLGGTAELPVDLTLTGANLDSVDLETPRGRRRTIRNLKWISTWLLEKETKARAQLSRLELTLSGLVKRQKAIARRLSHQRGIRFEPKPEVVNATFRALSQSPKRSLAKLAMLKPSSAGRLLTNDTLPWSVMLPEQTQLSAYC